MRYDFTYVQALEAKARRERSEAIYTMLIAPLVALLVRRAAKKAPHTHAARPHFAR
jgi:hypothetical protein